ncbi:MAG: TolC family outer membrane protein [Rhodoferax sp.]|nr:TolC family outer membrane protein [Rhodoferax sp.]
MNRTTPRFSLRLLPLLMALGCGFTASAQAQSLVDLYNAARGYDASFQSARSQYDATLARADQAQALLMPTVGLQSSLTRTTQEPEPLSERSFNTQTNTLIASQPLYRPANLANYKQGKKQTEVAKSQMEAAEQDLIVRVSQAYFDVLAASDNLTFVRSQKAAVGEQLASAKRNFEVGTSTITDSREAQARYDLVIAQEIAADNDLRVKSLALTQLVGISTAAPKPMATPVALGNPQGGDIEQWVRDAIARNPLIQQQTIALEVAQLETEKARAGHKPTVDLNASYNAINGGSYANTNDARLNQTAIGVTLNLPLFAGNSVRNRVKETVALEDKARTDLEATTRSVTQGARKAFLDLQAGAAQVKAFEAAEISTQSALDANKLGYQVGVRINIDVLNSQSQLYDTKAKLAKARYDVLVGGLKLRQVAGTLKADDLQPINSLLAK